MKIFGLAAVLATLSFSPASALVANGLDAGLTKQNDMVVQVQHRPRHFGKSPRYRPGARYRQAPRGWHRFHQRPSNWRTRGCVIVGPLWFCP